MTVNTIHLNQMESILKAWKTNRNLYLEYFENYSLEQLNKVPKGFNNNLIWNIGHIIVAQQALIYLGSGHEGHVPDELFQLYKPGTRPMEKTTAAQAKELQHLLIALIDITETDYHRGKFTTYKERVSGTGFHLGSINDAFEFNNYHEGLHLGCMMSIRKFV